MSVLAIAEVKNGQLKKISKELVSVARKVSDKVYVLLIDGSDEHARDLFATGADIVIKNTHTVYSPQGYANIIATVAKEKDAKLILAPHGIQGKDYAGRLAVKCNASLIADVVNVQGSLDEIEVKKPIYSGKAYANIKVKTPVVVTVRPNSQEIISHSGPETIEASDASEGEVSAQLSDMDESGASKISLTEASVIVSGGRGIKSPENWPILQSLCDTIGAALGASRAAVDAGWIPHDHQVGQTGKTVSPNCYIACGISGAIQHLAGMGSSKVIVAVNKDVEAPIFKVATYGIVEDLFVAVPAIDSEFKKALG